VILFTKKDGRMTTRELASVMQASEAHLSKVLQRLVHAGLVNSTRGPNGGFSLAKGAYDTTLGDVYEVIDGPVVPCDCLLALDNCIAGECVVGCLLATVNREVEKHFKKRKLRDVVAGIARES